MFIYSTDATNIETILVMYYNKIQDKKLVEANINL